MRTLNDLIVRRLVSEAKASGKRSDYRDAGCRNLELRVGPAGGSWRMFYSDARTGQKERLKIGVWPHVGLAEARRRVMEEMARVKDPRVRANPAKEVRDRAGAMTFREAAEARLGATGDDALADRSRAYYRWSLEKYAYPSIGGLPVGEVRTEDVLSVVDAVAERGSLVTADRTRASISSVLSWCKERRMVASNVALGLARRASSLPRDRVLDESELRLLLRELAEERPSRDMALLLSILLYSGARSSEVRLAAADEVRDDGHNSYRGPVWVLAGDRLERGRRVRGRTKSGREKALPLPPRLRALFREAAEGKEGRLFDVSAHEAVSRAIARMSRRLKLERRFTPHDLRRTMSTWMGDHGVRPDVIENILGHAPQGVTRQHYQLSLLLPLMEDALQQWSDHLDGLSTQVTLWLTHQSVNDLVP